MSWVSIPGQALGRHTLNECYHVQSSSICKITPEETGADQPDQEPKAGRGGNDTRIPSTAFFPPQSPAAFPCAHGLIPSLPAWNGCQVIEIPPCLETAPSYPSPPCIPRSHVGDTWPCPLIGSVWTCFSSHMHDEVKEVGMEKEKQEVARQRQAGSYPWWLPCLWLHSLPETWLHFHLWAPWILTLNFPVLLRLAWEFILICQFEKEFGWFLLKCAWLKKKLPQIFVACVYRWGVSCDAKCFMYLIWLGAHTLKFMLHCDPGR